MAGGMALLQVDETAVPAQEEARLPWTADDYATEVEAVSAGGKTLLAALRCEKRCSGRGACLGGVCVCTLGHSGDDCEIDCRSDCASPRL